MYANVVSCSRGYRFIDLMKIKSSFKINQR